jgi:hypothetical protein
MSMVKKGSNYGVVWCIIIIIIIIIYFLLIAKDVTNTETTVMYGLRISQTA